MKPILAAALAALLSLFATDTPAVESPPSVAALFSRVPELPATADEAASWVDKTGRIVHPGLLALRADIDAHQRAIGQIQRAAAERRQAQSAIVVENLGKGMVEVGIDMARMQRDPAYAQQVQERMRKMSPQELMAMSQKMNQPLNQDKRHQNQAQAMVEDSAVNRAAAEAGEAYAGLQMKRLGAHTALWRETEEAVARVMKKPLAAPNIVRYDGAAIAEISDLLDRITDSVKRAAVVVHCGKQIVLAPGAVCR